MQRKRMIGTGITIFAVALGLLWLIPLIWLIGTAFSEPSFHMTLFPTTAFTLENIKYVWNAIPFGTYYLNTLTLVVCTFAVQFVTSTLAAYALGVMNFKGSSIVFAVIFMQIIIPNDVLITPNFMTLSEMKLIDTKVGMMLPFYGSALAIFLLRQHFKSIPKALAEDLAGVYALRQAGLPVLCGNFRQLPLEQLPVAPDRDEFTGEPHSHRWPGDFCQVKGGKYAVGKCVCRCLYHHHSAAISLLRRSEAVYEQLCECGYQGVMPF